MSTVSSQTAYAFSWFDFDSGLEKITTPIIKYGVKLYINFRISTEQLLKFENGK